MLWGGPGGVPAGLLPLPVLTSHINNALWDGCTVQHKDIKFNWISKTTRKWDFKKHWMNTSTLIHRH
jgi:hypothetical protein